jgi:hypothetical protein
MRHGRDITPPNHTIVGHCPSSLLEIATIGNLQQRIDLAFALAIIDQKPARGPARPVYTHVVALHYFLQLDYDNVITYQSKAVQVVPENSDYCPVYLGMLGRFLLMRFESLRLLTISNVVWIATLRRKC